MTTNKNCPLCQGRGWYDGTTYDINFGWHSSPCPCPDCITSEPFSRGEKALLIALLLILVGTCIISMVRP